MSAIHFSPSHRGSFSSPSLATGLMAKIHSLDQAIQNCDWLRVRELSQSLTTSGRQLALQHIQQSGTFNPLPHAENLFKALASSHLQWEDETKHQLARAARLFLELACMKSAKEKREIYQHTAKDLRDQIDKLLYYTTEGQVGLCYELTCSSEALKLIERVDITDYLSTLLGALGGLSPGSIPELVRLIPNLINKMHKEWFPQALYLSWTGVLARDNRAFFDSHCAEISLHLETLETTQTAVEFLGDIIWQGSSDIQYQALVQEKVGLIALASQPAPKRTLFNLTPKMWPVRYRAVQILSTLTHHHNPYIAQQATEALLHCSLRETNPKVRKLFDELEKNPNIRQQWKEPFELKKNEIFTQNIREQEELEKQEKALKERERTVFRKAAANEFSSQKLAQERQAIEQEKAFIQELKQECLAHKANVEAMHLKILKGVNVVLDEILTSQSSSVRKEDPPHFLCPILGTLMKDPVIADDEHTYERSAIEKWVQENGTSPLTREIISNRFMANRSLRDAIEEYRKTLISMPSQPLVLSSKSQTESIPFYAQMVDKKISRAEVRKIPLENFLKAIEKEPQNGTLYTNLGRRVYPEKSVSLLNGTRMTEQQLYLKAIDLDPTNALAYNSLGTTLPSGGSVQLLNGINITEQQLYLKAIDLDPTHALAYNNLGTTLPSGGTVQLLNGTEMTQQQLYLKAIDLDPTNALAYNNLGAVLPSGGSIQLLSGTKMTKQELYLKAIDVDPTDALAYYNLGITLPSGGSVELLNGTKITEPQLYLKTIDLDPTLAQAYTNLGNTLPSGGSVQLLNGTKMTKQQLYLKAIDFDPTKARAYHNLGNTLPSGGSIQLLNGTKMTEQQLYLKAIDLDSTYVDSYIDLGAVLPSGGSIQLLNGTKMTQQQLFLKAIDLDPTYALAYNNLGCTIPEGRSILFPNGTKMTQQQLYLKAIDLDPTNALAYNNLGTTLPSGGTVRLLNGTKMTKQQLYLKAIDLNLDYASAYSNLAQILSSKGKVKLLNGAEMTKQELCLQAIQLDPNNKDAYYNLGLTVPTGESITLLDGRRMSKKELLVFRPDLYNDRKLTASSDIKARRSDLELL